jgi:hypothetical protein
MITILRRHMSGKATNQELARRNLPEPDFWPPKKALHGQIVD